jgi:hypothetical protein
VKLPDYQITQLPNQGEISLMQAENGQSLQNAQNADVPPALLMLDQPRILTLREGKRDYTFYFRRILQPDWEKYFSGLYRASRSDGVAQTDTTDLQTSGIELLESTLTRVEGYARELNTQADFKKVYPRHAMVVAGMMSTVFISPFEDDKPLDCDLMESRIDALWSKTTAAASNTTYKGLVHRFLPPTIEQKKRYMRGGAISRVGGTRKGATTIYSTRNKLLMGLYDELIQSVDGYGVDGKPLEGVEIIRREMDGYHKAESIAQLFYDQTEPATAAEAA